MFSSFQLPQEGFARLAQAQLQHPERTPRVRATRQKVLGVCKGARRVWLQKAQIVGIDTVYFSHVAASAARCRRDNCLLWPRLVTAAACRVCRRLGEHAVPAKRGGWLLASRIGTGTFYTTVQVWGGGSPTSAVHVLPQAARLCG
jgi:hypothetical protein